MPRVLEEALAANALNALADDPPTELATLSPESGKWQPRVPAGVREGGRYAPMHGGGRTREPESRRHHDRFGCTDTATLLADPERNAERGRAALEEVLRTHRTVDRAVYREETGWIRMDWGDPGDPNSKPRRWQHGHGISHIQAGHEEHLKYLPEVLAKGEIFKHEQEGKLYIVHGSRFAVVASLKKGGKKTITEFEPERPKEIDRIRQQPRAHVPGEN